MFPLFNFYSFFKMQKKYHSPQGTLQFSEFDEEEITASLAPSKHVRSTIVMWCPNYLFLSADS